MDRADAAALFHRPVGDTLALTVDPLRACEQTFEAIPQMHDDNPSVSALGCRGGLEDPCHGLSRALEGPGSGAPADLSAEAYEDSDRFREGRWGCGHEHPTVETALNCGQEWLNAQQGPLTETA